MTRDVSVGEFVIIRWRDACALGGWQEVNLPKHKMAVTTVGLMIHEDEDVVVLAQSWDDEENYGNLWYLPKTLIEEVECIEKEPYEGGDQNNSPDPNLD